MQEYPDAHTMGDPSGSIKECSRVDSGRGNSLILRVTNPQVAESVSVVAPLAIGRGAGVISARVASLTDAVATLETSRMNAKTVYMVVNSRHFN